MPVEKRLDGRIVPAKSIRKLSKDFTELPPQKVVEALIENAKNYNYEVFGYDVFPLLKSRLSSDLGLFQGLIDILEHPQGAITEDFGYTLFEFLEVAAASQGLDESILSKFRESLPKIIKNDNLPVAVLTQAIRSLAWDRSAENAKVILETIENGKQELVNAAADVLWTWSRASKLHEDHLYPELVKLIAKYSVEQPFEAIRSPSILGLFAYLGTDVAKSTIKHLVEKASKPEHWASLLSVIGSQVDHGQLAKIVKGVMNSPTPLSIDVLTGLVAKTPTCLEKLFVGGHHNEYLFALTHSRNIGYPGWTTHLTQLVHSTKPNLSSQARRISYLLPYEKRLELYNSGVIMIKPIPDETSLSIKTKRDLYVSVIGAGRLEHLVSAEELEPLYSPITETSSDVEEGEVEGEGEWTFAHRGDALYRAGASSHWHAGLYLGFSAFSAPSSEFWMRGIHNARMVDGVLYFIAKGDFSNPDLSVKTKMQELKTILIFRERGTGITAEKDQGGFARTSGDSTFYGRRSRADLTASERVRITEFAIQCHGQYIDWYANGMLWQKGTGWDGSIDDIRRTRCDGLVEYIYEKCGFKVCGGKHPDEHWRISKSGSESLDSHEYLHPPVCDTDWSQGDLCPRTQAGNVGEDTTFSDFDVEAPVIRSFSVLPSCGAIPPMFSFEVSASFSETVFVRITVKKDEGNLEFVIADDTWQCGDLRFGSPVGKMNLMEVTKNQSIFWFGKTGSGSDFWGQEGNYEFRLTVVDQGGNVSKTRYYKLDLNWPDDHVRDFLLSEFPDPTQERSLFNVSCVYNTRESFQTKPKLSGVITPQLGGLTKERDTVRCDIYDLTFDWASNIALKYSILVDSQIYVDPKTKVAYHDIDCSGHPINVSLRFLIEEGDSYRREVTIQVGDSDCYTTIFIDLEPPSIRAIPYMHERDAMEHLQFPEALIKDADFRDVVVVVEEASTEDRIAYWDRVILVEGEPPAIIPDDSAYRQYCPTFTNTFGLGYISKPVYCDFLTDALITPGDISGRVYKTSSNGQQLTDTMRELSAMSKIRFEISGEPFFESADYDNDVRRFLEFEIGDVCDQRATGQLTFYAKSLLCIRQTVWRELQTDPHWGSLRERLTVHISEELISHTEGLDWDDRVNLDQKIGQLSTLIGTRMKSTLDTVLSDRIIWNRIRTEGMKILKKSEIQLSQMVGRSLTIKGMESALSQINQTLAEEYQSIIIDTFSRSVFEMSENQQIFRDVITSVIDTKSTMHQFRGKIVPRKT